MKFIIPLFAVAILSCANKTNEEAEQALAPKDTIVSSNEKPANLLVVPGQSIGNIALEKPAQTLQFLGPADLSDAAMGKSWQTWFSKIDPSVSGKYELNVYTEYKDNELREKVVRQVRVTSPDFKTPEGVATGSSLMEIVESYPNIKWVGKFKNPDNNNVIEVFDDSISGIAFEIEQNNMKKICLAIIVHPKDQNVTEQYLSFHPDMERQ